MKRTMYCLLGVVIVVFVMHQIVLGQGNVERAKMEVRSVVFSRALVKFVEYFNGFLINWWQGGGRNEAAVGEWRVVILEIEPVLIGGSWLSQAEIGVFRPEADNPSYKFRWAFGPAVRDGELMLAAVQAKAKTVKTLKDLTKQVTRERSQLMDTNR